MSKMKIFVTTIVIMLFAGCGGIFDTSTYWYEMPSKEIMANGKIVHNPDYDEYVRIYGDNPDASKPKRVYPTNLEK